MKKRYAVDRIEEGKLVLLPDEGEDELILDATRYPFSVNDILDVTIEDESVTDVTPLPEESATRVTKNADRLAALFAKGKKK